jgi:hypothetical protein
MPTDLSTLQSIGFSDIPSWYREKGGLESLRSGPSSTGLPKGNWRKPSTPPKTIAYHDEDTQDNGIPLFLSLVTVTFANPSRLQVALWDQPRSLVTRLSTTPTMPAPRQSVSAGPAALRIWQGTRIYKSTRHLKLRLSRSALTMIIVRS